MTRGEATPGPTSGTAHRPQTPKDRQRERENPSWQRTKRRTHGRAYTHRVTKGVGKLLRNLDAGAGNKSGRAEPQKHKDGGGGGMGVKKNRITGILC